MKNKFVTTTIFILNMIFVTQAQNKIQYWRNYDKTGINIFETKKEDSTNFEELKVRVGGNFTHQFQYLEHSNTATAKYDVNKINTNELMKIGSGFNLATANLNMDVQLADGMRMNLILYLSSRHHQETWVKGGYLQIDKLPFLKSRVVDKLMQFITLRIGHMEINYGDAHFHRTDNGNAFYNPFVGNYIMDAFTTEIGGEIYFHYKGFLAMGAVTNGEIKGDVTNPDKRNPALYGKICYDKKLKNNFRFRLTASAYTTNGSASNTLYSGDRAGSRYYMVLENTLATTSTNFTSGKLNPSFNNKVTAFVVNPFFKFKGLEIFGNLERAEGNSSSETAKRIWTQIGVDVLYRFGKNENFYLAGRYNQANGELQGFTEEVSIERVQAGTGWFITKNILAKVEYVNQQYFNYPKDNILNGGKFSGVMLEGAIAF